MGHFLFALFLLAVVYLMVMLYVLALLYVGVYLWRIIGAVFSRSVSVDTLIPRGPMIPRKVLAGIAGFFLSFSLYLYGME